MGSHYKPNESDETAHKKALYLTVGFSQYQAVDSVNLSNRLPNTDLD